MDERWSLYTGGIATRRHNQDARRELKRLGVLVPPSLRARTALLHFVITALTGVIGAVVSLLAAAGCVALVDRFPIALEWQPLPWVGAFLLGFGLCFAAFARGGQLLVLLLYRRAFKSLAALEGTSGAVSRLGSVAIPGAGGRAR